MARGLIGRAFLPTACFALLASPAHAQDLGAMIAALGDQVCSLDRIPAADQRLLATTTEHRIHLHLRCELKGRDEFVRTDCCEHLNAADKRATGLCSSDSATEATMQEFKKSRKC